MENKQNWWNAFCAFFFKRSEKVVKNNRLVARATVSKLPKATEALCDMEAFLQQTYDFRFNQLSETSEYRLKNRTNHHFKPITSRELNSFCLKARKQGIDCWDRDISRYIQSDSVAEYHPFRLYMEELPQWDGKDRVGELARRVSDTLLWCTGFHRWMQALAAGWLGMDDLHANSVAPVLVSRRQGCQKSTFCKLLLPAVLQPYYTDSFDLTGQSGCEQKLAAFGLINLDEFDKFSPKKMSLLKNLMQMAGMNIRKSYQKNFSNLPRIASFIATSNQKELLTDPTGSRRFLCVEVFKKIDCSPIDHAQLYAQLKHELQAGARYWFTSEEEAEIQASNAPFYKRPVEEEVFFSCFRPAASSENALCLSASEIFQRLKRHNPSAMRSVSAANFSRLLVSLGVERLHLEFGNRYRVVALAS